MVRLISRTHFFKSTLFSFHCPEFRTAYMVKYRCQIKIDTLRKGVRNMKKLFGFIIILGFVIMIGAAGSADNASLDFVAVLLFELLGIALVLLGTSLFLNYKRYLARRLRKSRFASCKVKRERLCTKQTSIVKIRKELC